MTTVTSSLASPITAPSSINRKPTDLAQTWRGFFDNWPAKMPRTGVVVTALDEQIPFGDFQTAEEFMLLVRRAPDSMGSRQVVLPYSKIVAFKVTDVVDGAIFEGMGFAKPAKKK